MSDRAGTVSYTVRDDVGYLKLQSPPLNVLTGAMMGEISGVLERASADEGLKAIAITAEGKAFSAGADVGEHRPEEAGAMIEAFSEMFRRFGELQVPVVMAVDGAALGAGFELVLMADVLIASERARFGQPEIRLGFFAPLGVAWLPRIVGPARASPASSRARNSRRRSRESWTISATPVHWSCA
jgi:cyclohexa-1,5-dienecarbonyl-CoA hydratase